MTGLLERLSALPQLQELLAALSGSGTCCAAVTGLSPVHRAMAAAALAARTGRPLLLLCADEKDAQRQAADIRVLLDIEPVRLPERELQLRPAAYSRQWENARLAALYRMAKGDAPVVVATAAALVQRCLPRVPPSDRRRLCPHPAGGGPRAVPPAGRHPGRVLSGRGAPPALRVLRR